MPRTRSPWKTLLLAGVALAALATVAFVWLSAAAVGRRAAAARAWSESLGTFEAFRERFPSRSANESALRVEALTAPLGIDIASRSFKDRTRPDPAQKQRFQEAKGEIGDYYSRQIEKPEAGVDTPPPIAREYFDEFDAALDALRRQLVEGPEPRWVLEIERLGAARLPNLLGHIDLHKLLVARALTAAADGRPDEAHLWLEASWRLNTSLRDDPVLINQLIAIAAARLVAGALRHLDPAPAVWRERLREHDFKISLLNALQLEALVWLEIDSPDGPFGDVRRAGLLQRVAFRVGKPYFGLWASEVSEEQRRQLVTLHGLEYLCDRDLSVLGIDAGVQPTWWDRILQWHTWRRSRIDFRSSVDRVARLELDLELTDKLLQLRLERAERGGRWPRGVRGIDRSTACPRDRWVYEAEPSGEMSIAFSRPITWPDQGGAILPTGFVSSGVVP